MDLPVFPLTLDITVVDLLAGGTVEEFSFVLLALLAVFQGGHAHLLHLCLPDHFNYVILYKHSQ